MENLPLLIIIGTIAGIMSGMFGIGGGAIIVPSLMLFLGFSQKFANGGRAAHAQGLSGNCYKKPHISPQNRKNI